jgi:beta-phosphoglucomutase-like phosphatase (HAD superfamily)
MPPRAAIAALIFDLDGTLVDSEGPGLEVLHAMAVALGAPWQRETMHARYGGVPMAHCVAELARAIAPQHQPLDQAQFVKDLRANMALRFKQDLEEIPGATALLKTLQTQALQTHGLQTHELLFAIGTNGPREKAELTLGLTGLRPYFGERLFCAPEVGSFKPEPGLFLHVAAALGCEPHRCAVVEDSLPGLLAGLAAGMQVFSLHPRAGLPMEVAQQVHFIDGLPALEAWLTSFPTQIPS